MLSIGVLGGGAKQYYLELSRGDYYHAGGEPEGHWHGKGAERLGLSGTVGKEAFDNIFEGFNKDGEALVKNAGYTTRRAGWDLTFSAPKSVSVLWSQADEATRAKIASLHEQAVKTALEWLEKEASYTRTGTGGEEFHRAGIVAALFEHGTSRARDPQLHTHTLIFNVGMTEEGHTGSFYSQEMYRNTLLMGAIYQSEFAHLLTKEMHLGTRWKKDTFELQGVPESVCEWFSKRRTAIKEWLQTQLGEATAEKSQWAALATRGSKEHVARADLFPEWQESGRGLGFGPEEATALIQQEYNKRFGHTDNLTQVEQPPKSIMTLEQGIEQEIARMTRGQAAFSERAILRSTLTSPVELELSFKEIQERVKAFLADSPLVVHLGTKNNREHYTTQEILGIETDLLASVRGRTGEEGHRLSTSHVETIISWGRSKGENLSEEQEKALWHITEEAGATKVISGMAGTGKTTLLKAARQAWELDGYRVLGASLAGKAARGLEDGAGIQSGTITRLLIDLEGEQAHLSPKTILVIDEAAMVDTRQMGRLIHHAEVAGAKVVLVGDERQLQPIEIGGAFQGIAGITGKAGLSDIRRQRDGWLRDAVKDIAEGRAEAALSALYERGRLFVGEERKDAREQLIRDWGKAGVEYPEDNLILSGTRKEVSLLNKSAQEKRQEAGKLGETNYPVEGFLVYEGDRVKFTKNHKALNLFNGDFGTITHIDKINHVMQVELDRGELVTVPLKDYANLTLGYASTTHAAQGVTVENAYILTGDLMTDKHMGYVQVSRVRGEAYLYTDKGEGNAVQELARLMEKNRKKEMAFSIHQAARAEMSL
jgi:Ti-type conjugative transfer relaxase TraA